jgi:hypothetical protein
MPLQPDIDCLAIDTDNTSGFAPGQPLMLHQKNRPAPKVLLR